MAGTELNEDALKESHEHFAFLPQFGGEVSRVCA